MTCYFDQLDELFDGRDSNIHLQSPFAIRVNNKEQRRASGTQSRNICERKQYILS